MAGLAAVTKKIKLFASTPVLWLPPAVIALMGVTIDSIAPGRFGINIVTVDRPQSMTKLACGLEMIILGPLRNHQLTSKISAYVLNRYRYEYATEYVQVMKDLWTKGRSDFKGKHFTMEDCGLLPLPSSDIKLIAAGQSGQLRKMAAH
jgi:pyrimidine oxygenase